MTAAAAQTRFDRYVYPACLTLCALGLVAAIWAVPYLPTNDGPQSVFAAHVDNHHGDPDSLFARQFELQPGFAARGFSLLYRPLLAAFGWAPALRLLLCVVTLTWAGGFAWLTVALHPQRRAMGLLGFVLALSWPLYMGFFSFAMATSVGLVVAAHCVSRAPLTLRGRIIVSLVLFGNMSLHAFGGVLSCALVGTVVLVGARRGDRARELVWLAATAAPVSVFVLWIAGARESLEKMPFAEALTWEPLGVLFRRLPHLLVPGPVWRGAFVIALATTSLVLWVRGRRARPPHDIGLFVAAVVLLVAGCAAPLHIPGWQFFGPRFLPFGVAAAIAILPLERLPQRLRPLREPVFAAMALAGLWVSARLHDRMYEGCRAALSGLEQPFRRSFMQLPVALDASYEVDRDRLEREVPYSQPLLHAGALYAVAHGGSTPWVFAGTSAVHTLRIREPTSVPVPPTMIWAMSSDPTLRSDARLRRAMVTEVAAWGTYYENVVVFGARPEDEELLQTRGYLPEWQQGSLFIGKFEPCPLEISISVERSGEPVEVSYGAWGLREVASYLLPADRFEPGAASPVQAPTLCGDLWVRVISKASGAKCRQAREDGKMRVIAVRPRTDVACDLAL